MAEESGVKVLTTWASMFGMRVLIALNEKGVEYEYREEDLGNKSKLLLDSSPIHKKIPVLIHNGKPVCESLIIVQYIDEAWPSVKGKDFLPKDPYQRALARFWGDYIDKKIYDVGSRIVMSPDGEAREQAKKDLTECFATLDGAHRDVCGGGPYFGGEGIGLVDIALAPFIPWFQVWKILGGFELPDQTQCPHLNAWMKKIVEYPSVKEAMAHLSSDKLLELIKTIKKKILGV